MSTKTYLDYSFSGELNFSGTIKEYIGAEAISNAVKAWMMSFQGEVLRRPSLGGVLIPFLIKPMSESMARVMRDKLESGLRTEFVPRVLVKTLNITPDFENDCYDIKINGYCPSIRGEVKIDESVNRILL